jgi:hypothetical protein
MAKLIQISGRILGELNHVAYCERCVWIKLRLQNRLPYQVFPGIFSSIDAYTKRVIERQLRNKGLPAWLSDLGDVTGFLTPPPYQEFQVVDDETGIRLTGVADAILLKSDGSYLIADYKTSKYTAGQDMLRLTYEGQLNAYAWIGERTGFFPVAGLALVYMHPLTTDEDAQDPANLREYGFAMGFSPRVQRVGLQPDLVPRLLRQARELHDRPMPPEGRINCKDCEKVGRLLDLLR